MPFEGKWGRPTGRERREREEVGGSKHTTRCLVCHDLAGEQRVWGQGRHRKVLRRSLLNNSCATHRHPRRTSLCNIPKPSTVTSPDPFTFEDVLSCCVLQELKNKGLPSTVSMKMSEESVWWTGNGAKFGVCALSSLGSLTEAPWSARHTKS